MVNGEFTEGSGGGAVTGQDIKGMVKTMTGQSGNTSTAPAYSGGGMSGAGGLYNDKEEQIYKGDLSKGSSTKGAAKAFDWTGNNFKQIGKNMTPGDLIKNLENSGWTKVIEPGGKKSGLATIFTDPSTGTKVRIHAQPGEGTPYFKVQNKGGGYLDDTGKFPSNATRQELRDLTHFYFE